MSKHTSRQNRLRAARAAERRAEARMDSVRASLRQARAAAADLESSLSDSLLVATGDWRVARANRKREEAAP